MGDGTSVSVSSDAAESSRSSPPYRPREDGLAHPTNTSRSNLAAGSGLTSGCRTLRLNCGAKERGASTTGHLTSCSTRRSAALSSPGCLKTLASFCIANRRRSSLLRTPRAPVRPHLLCVVTHASKPCLGAGGAPSHLISMASS